MMMVDKDIRECKHNSDAGFPVCHFLLFGFF